MRAWLSHNGTFPEKDICPVCTSLVQEIVDLSAANVIATDSESHTRTMVWQNLLLNEINAIAKPEGIFYEALTYKYLVGVALCIFVSSEHRGHISNVQEANAASGIMGVLGNKGGSSIRFRFYDTTVCFVCSRWHSPRHRSGPEVISLLSKRRQSLNITARIITSKVPRTWLYLKVHEDRAGILDHDVVVWLGDLNYRPGSVTIDVAYEMIGKEEEALMLKWDQLNRERGGGHSSPLKRCNTFQPSYNSFQDRSVR